MATTTDRLLDYEGLAELLGIGLESARAYNARATHHRKLAARTGDPNHVRPGDLPEPDSYFGQSPAWYESTIKAWDEQRPGRGKITTPPPTAQLPIVRNLAHA
ncbi:helix-turn-helix DNA binding domain protein [Arthrobacter phage Hirko]|nr:helix-turn-helix DNA binding domain protein [Arthrobacter phage Hirko]